jgi:hypothetical protein
MSTSVVINLILNCSIILFQFTEFIFKLVKETPPLWSSGQSSWLQSQRSRVRFPALPHFLRSSETGTGSIQPRENSRGVNGVTCVAEK